MLIPVAERRTGQRWSALARELGRIHAVSLTGPTGTVTQTTELTTAPGGHCFGPRLTCTNAGPVPPGICSHTPRPPTTTHNRRSTPELPQLIDRPTAEVGVPGAGARRRPELHLAAARADCLTGRSLSTR